MTTNPAGPPRITWHHDLIVGGNPYPTRHPAADGVANSDTLLVGLTGEHRTQLRAIHEAAHAVAGLTANAHIHHATITRGAAGLDATPLNHGQAMGDVCACNFPDGQAYAVFLGAGERAEDLWLRRNGLWTPQRAAGVELGASGDRAKFFSMNPHFGFGTDANDYAVVHALADDLVLHAWDAITTVAQVLAAQLHLTGNEIADLAALPNGTGSGTCLLAA